MSRRNVIITVISISGLLLLFLAIGLSVRQNMGWCDAVTGSMKHQTRWIFGIETTPVIEPSALAKWLMRQKEPVVYDWRWTQGTKVNILGQGIGSEHGRAPLVYQLRTGDLLENFVQSSTEEQLHRFIRVMQQGTEEEQELAVKAALKKAMSQ